MTSSTLTLARLSEKGAAILQAMVAGAKLSAVRTLPGSPWRLALTPKDTRLDAEEGGGPKGEDVSERVVQTLTFGGALHGAYDARKDRIDYAITPHGEQLVAELRDARLLEQQISRASHQRGPDRPAGKR